MQVDESMPVVFCGPSVSPGDAALLLNARCLPPAKRGDIERVTNAGARCIVLIDGEMIYNAPPSPLEMRDAMRQGVVMFGAASLGALRAVELFDHGMQGMGWVYGAFMSRRVDCDDELLSVMDPSTFSNLTVPLVNVRHGLCHLADRGLIRRSQAAALMSSFRAVHFEKRTSIRLKSIATATMGECSPELAEVCEGRSNIKRRDAVDCLRFVAANLAKDDRLV